MKLLFILLLLYSAFVDAKVYKCLSENGKISYSDVGCDSKSAGVGNANNLNVQKETNNNNLFKQELSLNSIYTFISEAGNKYSYRSVILVYFLMSGLCYYTYRKDKKYAKTNQWRVPESTLHMYELFGGWPGGLIAQRILRHKNKKLSYQISFWLIVVLHIIGWYDYLMLNQQLLHHISSLINSAN